MKTPLFFISLDFFYNYSYGRSPSFARSRGVYVHSFSSEKERTKKAD